ncbi:hypothetical protein ACFQ1S_43160 [Kibdelosporangium lantanae]|uniref:Uncharacterized protein n=1 Tax=Kibdelosporangium lantanae TaxID=1497396 RepID=A0ABW3MMT9_9PSEU
MAPYAVVARAAVDGGGLLVLMPEIMGVDLQTPAVVGGVNM